MKEIFTAVLLVFALLSVSACDEHKKSKRGSDKEHEHEHEHGGITASFADFHMTVLGDSMSVGLLSDTKLGTFPADNAYFAALLDPSLSQPGRADLDEYYKHQVNTAYSSAKHCHTLACSIEHNSFHVSNLAVSGARLARDGEGDIEAQLMRADEKATHFIIEAGANDFCAVDYDQQAVLDKLKDMQSKILARGDHVQLMLVAVPDIVHLFTNVAPPEHTAFVDAGADPDNSDDDTTYTCAQIRDGDLIVGRSDGEISKETAASCPRMVDVGNGAPDYVALSSELGTLNAEIAKLSGDRTAVVSSVGSVKFEAKHVAADCFHPSQAGLQLLAQEMFGAVRDTWKPYRIKLTPTPAANAEDETEGEGTTTESEDETEGEGTTTESEGEESEGEESEGETESESNA